MMRRFVALWLPTWPTDRLRRIAARRRPDRGDAVPMALATAGAGGLRLTAVDARAGAAGLAPGMTVATAQALVPGLRVRPADPLADARGLAALADWCRRFTPWAATDGADGLVLDITGCAHLLGDEFALVDRILASFRRFRITARAGLADTPAAAWALARFGSDGQGEHIIASPGATRSAVLGLPIAALRLPDVVVSHFTELGIDRVADLAALPRAPLAARFGGAVLGRLDAMLGEVQEPINPRSEVVDWTVRHAFTHPVASSAVVDAVLAALAARLCTALDGNGLGASRFVLGLWRLDRATQRVSITLAEPTHDPRHVTRIFALKLENLDLGLGIEAMTLAAPVTAARVVAQTALTATDRAEGSLTSLIDRLTARLGPDAVVTFVPVASHIPERAVRAAPPLTPAPVALPGRSPGAARPLRLFTPPEPIEAVAPLPDSPPLLFRWRGRVHRIAHAEGPERLSAEWWRAPAVAPSPDNLRDYYRVEDQDGERFWLYRRGLYRANAPAPWFLHGLFA